MMEGFCFFQDWFPEFSVAVWHHSCRHIKILSIVCLNVQSMSIFRIENWLLFSVQRRVKDVRTAGRQTDGRTDGEGFIFTNPLNLLLSRICCSRHLINRWWSRGTRLSMLGLLGWKPCQGRTLAVSWEKEKLTFKSCRKYRVSQKKTPVFQNWRILHI